MERYKIKEMLNEMVSKSAIICINIHLLIIIYW